MKEKIRELVENGLNNVEIGKIIGRDRNAVRKLLKEYNIMRSDKRANPNLIVDYFKTIDSKDKAYWFGYLCADGYVSKSGDRLVLDLKFSDKCLIDNFCNAVGANNSKITFRTHKCGSKSCRLAISNVNFVRNLINQGCTNRKSLTLEFKDFNNEELDMAYLMGYFDGDGYANSAELCSGSFGFLKKIKEKYNLTTKVRKNQRVFVLNLTAELKRKLMNNYKNSLSRKRFTYRGDKGYKTNKISPPRPLKFEISKEELEVLLKDKGYSEIGRMFNVTDNSIRKRAIKLGIELVKKKN